jgi:FMN phosphatase YigB (HAD superfamily)
MLDIKAVIIDVGGVLVRTSNRSSRQKWERSLKLADGKLDDVVFGCPAATLSTLGKVAQGAVWANVQSVLNITDNQLIDLISDFWRYDFVDKQLVSVLLALRPKYSTYILSNAWEGTRSILFQKYDIVEGNTVDRIFFSSELGLAKPDPNIFKTVSRMINLEFDKIMFIDDFEENIKEANDLGMKTIHFKDPDIVASILKGMAS